MTTEREWIGRILPNASTVLAVTWEPTSSDVQNGVVLCYISWGSHPFATWHIQRRNSDGMVDTFNGHYFDVIGKAVRDYENRGGQAYGAPRVQSPYHIWRKGEAFTYLVFGPYKNGTFDVEIHRGHVTDNKDLDTYVKTVSDLPRDTHIVGDLWEIVEGIVGEMYASND